MNIAVDYGNTTAKVGIFNNGRLDSKKIFGSAPELKAYLEAHTPDHLVVSSVSIPSEEVISWSKVSGTKIILTNRISLPIKINYKTPDTLGVDRIAAVCGALELYPKENCLVIDAGSCLTYEFLDATGTYQGGAISPGINMRFEAMHRFTARLPLAKAEAHPALVGDSTEASLQSGVINGIRAEVDGIISTYKKEHQGVKCLVCGGDAAFFADSSHNDRILAPDLVLIGLNRILTHALS